MALGSRRRFVGALLLAAALVAALFGSAPAGAVADGPRIDAQLARALDRLPAGKPYGAFVHFEVQGTAAQKAVLGAAGLRASAVFDRIDVVYATGTVRALRNLFDEPSVSFLESNRKLRFFQDTALDATRARAGEGATPFRDAQGRPLDGTGVGVAIVDSGILGSHPDFAGSIGANFKVVCSTPGLISTETEQCFGPVFYVEASDTDTTSGHGTHVAGIAGGDGSSSDGAYRGVAPGSTLYGYSTGEVISVLFALEAWQHILDNNASFSPQIRVVNNSWGDPGGTPYDPESVYSKMTAEMVASGLTMVFAAGNSGGDGSQDAMSSTAKDPTPGVIAVANYDDADSGTRDGQLSSSSSRGEDGDPANYPDVSAPGTNITSTCIQAIQPICNAGRIDPSTLPFYATISGTSMASPHVAGAVALLLQARPDLTPAQVEDVIQDTAHKFTFGGAYEADPQNSGGSTSFDKGAGLLDVTAALEALGVTRS
ncbi:MAG: S8 family serine peptidase [Actinomycetota bacterium]